MKTIHARQFGLRLGALLGVALLNACALAPGMYAGGIGEGYQVVSRDPQTGRNITVPVYPMSLQSSAAAPMTKLPQRRLFRDYQLGPGDVVTVTVWDHPELTIPAGEFRSAEQSGSLIDEDGSMFYPHCGRIRAQGMTRGQLRSELERCLSRVIRDPQVDVRVILFASQRATVGGAVLKPGTVALRNTPVHLADLIEEAGGLDETADLRHVRLSRGSETYLIDHKRYTETGDARLNPLIIAGDAVHIGSSIERQVAVLGEVQRPQTLGIRDGMRTLADALASASGLNINTAQADRILVMRADAGQPVVHWLQGKDPLSLLVAQSFTLQPGDVIYVDQTGLNRWGRAIGQILPIFGALTAGAAVANVSSN